MTPQAYTPDELRELGVRCGERVRVDRSVVLINPEFIVLGHDVRIDCFCVLSAGTAGLTMGSWIHVACGCYLFGGGGQIQIDDFCNLSSRVNLYTVNDDYTAGYMTNPLVPAEYRQVTSGNLVLEKHVIIGSGSQVLPGVTLSQGTSIGALSLVKENTAEFGVYAGIPARKVGERGRRLLEFEQRVRAAFQS